MKKKRLFVFILTFLVFLSSLALANGLNLNSLGTRALTMGGAFVGLADDFSAIFWNPAGIAQFDKQYFGFYGTDIIPSGTYKMEMTIPGIGSITAVDAKTKSKHYLAGMAAYFRPVSENIVAGLAVYAPSGLGSQWDGTDFTLISMNSAYDWMSYIRLITISPALAFKLNDQIFVGAALNINYGGFDVKTHAGDEELGIDIGQYEENLNGWGYGATLGILVKPSEKLSLGATFRTSSKINFSGDVTISKINILGMIPSTPLFGATIPTTSSVERNVTWPLWIAGGVAFRPVENLILTADIQWTQWKKIDVFETQFEDPLWGAILGKDIREMHWENATQIRFGAEYKMNTIAIRGGYYYDPSPAPDKTMNVLLPNYDFNVVTIGFGYNLDGLQVDFGFEYLMGKERNIPYGKTREDFPDYDPEWKSAMPGIYNMNIFVPNLSVSYKF